MQILLNIPDKYVSLEKSLQEMILEMHADGVKGIATILPQGHGRLIDADETIKQICGNSCGCTFEQCGNDYPCYSVSRIQMAEVVIDGEKE